MLRNKLLVATLLFLPTLVFAKGNFLADRHIQHGLKCQSCHAEMPPQKPVEKAACLKCHISYEALAKKTADVTPNPHDNHMTGGECSDCHHGHRPPALMCDSCHQFDLKIK
jgi:fumarate reductase flavoprotein subunit